MVLKKAGGCLFLILLTAVFICACGRRQEAQPGKTYSIYYVNNDETAISPYEYATETTDKRELLDELLEQLRTGSEKLKYKAPLSDKYELLDYTVNEDQLTLSFDENYMWQEVTTEVLVRAAIVRTLTQIDGISYVAFQIKSEPLTDAYGMVIGTMNSDMFIDNAGNEINTYEKVKLTLYFADESGSRLKPVSRTVVYNSNISMERLVVEQFIAGPGENEKAFPTVNPDTKIISVNVKDRICYVDFDNTFLTQIYNVTSDVAIYSLINSLAELSSVSKVQISINGDTNVNYKENIGLSTVFERNLELVGE
ncbi:MAG: GerMN domain-containing protein [Clostridium sp.]|nr:GerMN domain-containing protein [Clostridium sp.]